MIFSYWHRNKNKTQAIITGKVCCQHSSGSFYILSLWEFGKGPWHHFLPYLTDTADYTFRLALIIYIAFVNQNMKTQVVFYFKRKDHLILSTGMTDKQLWSSGGWAM